MIEVPSAAVTSDILAARSSFFSIGTNDLIQYTLAVDRGNEKVAYLYEPFHPGVLRLISTTIENARKHGIPVGMCGELAGMPKAIPILLGLGLDEFSMNPRSIPEAKYLIHKLNDQQSRQISKHVLELSTAADIEAYMKEVVKEF
jgi:phosphotransferase system enzyme I (PtsI)